MEIFEYSNKGQREVNQDYVVHRGLSPDSAIFVVADGMGGYAHGEVASKVVSDSIVDFVESNLGKLAPEKLLREAIIFANDELMLKRMALGTKKMGTVVSALLVIGTSAYICWLGDSRVYAFRDGEVTYKTEDHSIVSQMAKMQAITPDAYSKYSNIVTRCLMGDDQLGEVPVDSIKVHSRDVFVLCSDGFHKELNMNWALNYDDTQKEELDRKADNISDNYSFIKVVV